MKKSGCNLGRVVDEYIKEMYALPGLRNGRSLYRDVRKHIVARWSKVKRF